MTIHIDYYIPGAPELILAFSGVRVARSLVVCVVFCRLLFVLLLLCCLSLKLRILITPLVSSNSNSSVSFYSNSIAISIVT